MVAVFFKSVSSVFPKTLCFVVFGFIFSFSIAALPAQETKGDDKAATKKAELKTAGQESADEQEESKKAVPEKQPDAANKKMEGDETDEESESAPSEPTLTIGSKSPAIDIEHWLSDGDGKMEHVKELKKDQVYVVEFWATWCPPCIASMPHLSELQSKYADKGVQIISISDEPLETVQDFLDKKVKGKEQTFRELTKNYCLTTDPDGSVKKDYFEASGQSGIPTAMIVGKEGLIEWIGHPMEMDKPLDAVVEGTWDRDEFKKTMAAQGLDESQFSKFMEMIEKAGELAESGEVEEALELLDETLKEAKSDDVKSMLKGVRNQFVIIFVGGDQAVNALREMAQENKDDPETIATLVSMICSVHAEKPMDRAVLTAAHELAEKAIKQDDTSFTTHMAMAQILDINGEVDRALVAVDKAIELIDKFEAGDKDEEDWISDTSEELFNLQDKLKAKKAAGAKENKGPDK